MVTSRPQAAAAAELLRLIRPSWDALATANTILQACEDHSFRDVVWVAITCATDPANRSPRSILFAGNEWPGDYQRAAAEVKRRVDRTEQAAAQAERRRCAWCDERGYLPSGGRCNHDAPPESGRAAVARQHAQHARGLIRPGPPRIDQ